jgi:hypothetical protein
MDQHRYSQPKRIHIYDWPSENTATTSKKRGGDGGLTVKYCEYLEEYETFLLHFLHQKASVE